jgi:DNA-binding NarL/FixJ family response regulator
VEVTRILLVEDQYFARIALHSVLDSRDDMRIVAETANGADALSLYLQHRPDVTIVDIRLPGISGIEVIRAIRANDHTARIVVLSNYEGSEDVHRALNAGALSYLTKDADADALVKAIRIVSQGHSFIPPNLRGLLFSRHEADALTSREMDVLKQLTTGKSNRDIADHLGIAEKTVRIHMTRIFEKLHVSDRTQAVLVALQRGIVHID